MVTQGRRPLGRLGMVLRVTEEGEPVAQVARRDGHVPAVRVQMGAPLPEESQAGLEDRSSRPRCSPMRTSPAVEEQLLQARRVLRAPMRKIAAPLPRYRTPRNSGASFF